MNRRWLTLSVSITTALRMRSLTKGQWILAGLFLVYCLGYLMARSQHALIHRVAFATEGADKNYYHRVMSGDFGPGIFQSAGSQFVLSASHFVFTPLRWSETCIWYLIPRQYAV